ncbi:hypothetical protein [Reyranella sp.]|uniref:hypothetical protein n=1 Tax=Reyranella sp. TaxID=1929291 RepID=UPI003BAC0141
MVRLPGALVVTAALMALAGPALAEPRWLACKFTDSVGGTQAFHMVFDDIRNTAALFDAGQLIEGTNTGITFQALRSRFPQFMLTYNRNNGALSITPLQGAGGLRQGECRRSLPPPGAPSP